MIPVPGNDWKVWARQLTTALKSMPLQLRRRRSDSSAAEDGLVMWDAAKSLPVVSSGGVWVPIGSAWMERRLIATQTLANDTTVQAWFATANNCPLLANSTYEFEGMFSSINGTTSHGLDIEFAALAGASIRWSSIGSKVTNTAQATAQRFVSTNTFNTTRNATTASTVGGNIIWIRGVVITTAAGNLQPRIRQTAASGSFVVQPGTFFKVRRVGADTFVNSGEWA